jgi:hypothetical protein
MRSLIIFEVEHGETTDPVQQFVDEAMNVMHNVPDISYRNYQVKVDIPPCFELGD